MAKKSAPPNLVVLNCLSLGLYFVAWCSSSAKEVNASARQVLVTNAWYLLIPGLNFWWMWQYAFALERVTFKRIKAADVFVGYILITFIPTTFVSNISDFFRIFTGQSSTIIRATGYLASAIILWIIGSSIFITKLHGKIDSFQK